MHGLHRLSRYECSVAKTRPFWSQVAGKALLILCFLTLILALTACDDQGSVAQSTVIPSSPTPPQFQISTPPPVATVTFQAYTGSDFSLNYPQTWVVRAAGTVVSLSDASGTYNLTVNLQPNADGKMSANQLADTSLAGVKTSLNHPQHVAISATITLAGTTWSQRAVSGTTLSNGVQVEREVIILATNHPAHAANTSGIVLIYMGLKQSFAQARKTYFAPMLQTFAFLPA
jgi:hypothetical protein